MGEMTDLIEGRAFEERRRRYRARAHWSDVVSLVESIEVIWAWHLGLRVAGEELLATGALDRCEDTALRLAATPAKTREDAVSLVRSLRQATRRLSSAPRLGGRDPGYSMLAIAAGVQACLWSLRGAELEPAGRDEVEPLLGEASAPSRRDLLRRALPRGLREHLAEIDGMRADRELLFARADLQAARGASLSIVPTLLRCLDEPVSNEGQLEAKRQALVEHGELLRPFELTRPMIGPRLAADCLVVGATRAQEARLWSPLSGR